MACAGDISEPDVADYKLCLICQNRSDLGAILNGSEFSFGKIKDCAQARRNYAELEWSPLILRLEYFLSLGDFKYNFLYHKKCYQALTNKEKIERAKKRFDNAKDKGDITTLVSRQKGRPSLSTVSLNVENLARATKRSSRETGFCRKWCVFCQVEQDDTKEILHDVTTANMGAQLRQLAKNTTTEQLKLRLLPLLSSEDCLTAVAYDLKYHLSCLTKEKRRTSKEINTEATDKDFSAKQFASDLEILDVVRQELGDPSGKALSMNDLQITYLNILEDNGIPIKDSKKYKPYIKNLISENISEVHFNKPASKRLPELVLSTKVRDNVVESVLDEVTEDDIKAVRKVSKLLRRDIAKNAPWKFEGDFSNFQPPMLVELLCKNTIYGTRYLENERKKVDIDFNVNSLTQLFVSSYRTDKQVKYAAKSDNVSCFQVSRETPLTVGLSLDIHEHTRSKTLVSKLDKVGLGINYNKVLEIENDICNAVQNEMLARNGVCLPCWLVPDAFVWFAIDNIDFLENTPSGKDSLHGTAIACFQAQYPERRPIVQNLELVRSSKPLAKVWSNEPLETYIGKPDLKAKKLEFTLTTSNPNSTLGLSHQNDVAWVLASTVEETECSSETITGTWGAFNSLLSEPLTKCNVSLLAPLIRMPPTDYDTLFKAMRMAQKITISALGTGHKTVITFDLQLYDMAMKLWMERDEIKTEFLFRPGELHTVFWSLAALGKYIEGSGIDQAWLEAGLYSASTITKILGGKQMYRALEAHTVTFLTMYDLFFKTFLTDISSEENQQLQESAKIIRDCFDSAINDKAEFKFAVTKAYRLMTESSLAKKVSEYQDSANGNRKFILNYLKQFSAVLCYIRATRNGNLESHLEWTENLVKYFFAHDHIHYARLLPLYLQNMQDVKRNEIALWNELQKGFFCVTKSNVPFTSIGPDHGIEHENRKLKVNGGIIGITQNVEALDRFFTIAPQLASIVEDFEKLHGVNSKETTRTYHELTGNKASRLAMNVQKLRNVIVSHGNPLENSYGLCNILTNKVIEDRKISNEILNRDEIGQDLYKTFVNERLINGETSIWAPMKKVKLGVFKNFNAVKSVKIGEKITKISEERNLLQRFTVISRTRPELDLKECIGTYEFGAIPRALFSSDGSLLYPTDKAKVMHQLENFAINDIMKNNDATEIESKKLLYQSHENIGEFTESVVIIDGMAVVQSLQKSKDISTCSDLATLFLSHITRIGEPHNEIILVFDRYVDNSLKQRLRNKRSGGISTYYRIHDNTLIRNITMKELLSTENTKSELIQYFSEFLLKHSVSESNKLKRFVVTYGTQTKSNELVNPRFNSHSQEEADTIIVLHALNIPKTSRIVVESPDTDVFLLLIHFSPSLPVQTYFATGNMSRKGKNVPSRRIISIRYIRDALGMKRADALLGFHSFTGCDMTGKFAGKTKEKCFKLFLSSDDQVLSAFKSLGENNFKLTAREEAFHRYVCRLYGNKIFKTLEEYRWNQYSSEGKEGENLAPTRGALKPHILRSHFVAIIWKRSGVCQPKLPNIENFGWKKRADSTGYNAIQNCNLPAPNSILELVKCSCKKGCRGTCSCRRNGLSCSEACKCSNEEECSNAPKLDLDSEDINSSDSE